MNNLAWSDGTSPQRSKKTDNPNITEFKHEISKREEVSNKLSERELIGTGTYNPFKKIARIL